MKFLAILLVFLFLTNLGFFIVEGSWVNLVACGFIAVLNGNMIYRELIKG